MLLDNEGLRTWARDVPATSRGPVIAGFLILITWAVGFGAWAVLAPIDGAIVTSGAFVATGQNKQLQHLEGGIVREIAVREGDLVAPNDTLVRLDTTASRARLQRLRLRQFRLLALRTRLEAEATGELELIWPEFHATDEEADLVAEIKRRQRIEFDARARRFNDEVAVLRRESAGLQESIVGYEALTEATRKQMKLFEVELADKGRLLSRSLARKTDFLALQRSQTRLSGELGQLLSRIGDARQRIARADQQVAHLRSSLIQSAVEQLRSTESEIDDIAEQIRAARDVVKRSVVTAPVKGVVVKLNVHTSGGVVAPGAVILELLPVNEKLVIETRVQPSDITNVQTGQNALVRLSALNQRTTPMVEGKVTYVSADAVAESSAQASALAPGAGGSFVVRVALDERVMADEVPGFQPTPGMPADLFIKTGERTFLDYLLKPIVDSFSRAFREQ
ncbi:MAG: HlyD family type I secretion periplasmic adaptor subunit [Pseudomonadota bacterium]